jgi:hypothetical protein
MKTLTLFDNEYPAKYVVCPRCDGEGKHTNPAIDGNGITASEMHEILNDDPDFLEDYMGGMYDIPCTECHGKRVVLEIDEAECTPEQIKQYAFDRQCEYEYMLEESADRRGYY